MEIKYSNHPKLLDLLRIRALVGEFYYPSTNSPVRFTPRNSLIISGEVFHDCPSIISLYQPSNRRTYTFPLSEVVSYYERLYTWVDNFKEFCTAVSMPYHFEFLGERCYSSSNHNYCGRLHSIGISCLDQPSGRLRLYDGAILEFPLAYIVEGIPGCEEFEGEIPEKELRVYRSK